MRERKRYDRKWVIFLQDMLMSLLASLMSILLVRWVTEPISGFTWLVAKYLAISLAAMCAGELILRPYRDVRRFATVRSMGKVLIAILVKELLMLVVMLTGLLELSAAHAALALLADLLFSCAAETLI